MPEAPANRIRLTVEEARELARNSLQGIGYDAEEAAIIAEHVLDAALCGYEYSGLPKILNVAEHPRHRQPRYPMHAMRETDVSAMFDGGNNVGMLTMYRATKLAIAKAQKHGFAVIGVNNSWNHGRCAYYLELAARTDLVGIHTVSSTPNVAPLGGTKAALGTNPISFAFPTDSEPLVIDMGTSAFMSTDLIFRERRGELLPEGVAIDAEGQPTRDPAAARVGAILPFGGYKGFVLAFAIQALGVLAGSGTDVEQSSGYLLIVMKPDLLVPLEAFRRELSMMIARIKSTPRAAGVEEIRIPSERAFRQRMRSIHDDGIEIDYRVYEKLAALTRTGTKGYPRAF